MIIHFIIAMLLLFLFIGCKTTKNEDEISNTILNNPIEENATKKITLEEAFKYDVNEDYLINKKYHFRFKNENISSIVFHYTALSLKKSLKYLTSSEEGFSAHWLIPEKGNTIYKLSNEGQRVPHAGKSSWKNRKNINVISIGIEVVNLGFKCKIRKQNCPREFRNWIPYPEEQQKLIVGLAKDIQKRYNIDSLCIIGHTEISTDRKIDPGPLFPWKRLYENGVGGWVTNDEIQNEIININNNIQGDISRLVVQSRLYEFGYYVEHPKNSQKNPKMNSNRIIESLLMKHGYNLKETKLSNLSALNSLNEFGNKNTENNIFDNKRTDIAIDAFMTHYLPNEYLNNEIVDNKKILATLQALLIKYPGKEKKGCSF
jgi:N-acetylmuramoyl-L-alanine amidase